jgi:hypothetical protein
MSHFDSSRNCLKIDDDLCFLARVQFPKTEINFFLSLWITAEWMMLNDEEKKGWEMNERLKDGFIFLHVLLLFEKLQIYWLQFYYWTNGITMTVVLYDYLPCSLLFSLSDFYFMCVHTKRRIMRDEGWNLYHRRKIFSIKMMDFIWIIEKNIIFWRKFYLN